MKLGEAIAEVAGTILFFVALWAFVVLMSCM